MKFHHLAAAAALALSASLSHAVTPTLGAGSQNVKLAINVALSPTTPVEIDFDILGGPFSLLLTVAGPHATITSFDLHDAFNDQLIPFALKDTSQANIWSLTVNSGTGSYYASILGTGTATLKATVGPALAPVPEPETYGLALAGLIVAGVALRQRKVAA